MPFLINPAAASVGEPLISSNPPPPAAIFSAFRCSISEAAMERPIASLLNET